MPNRIESEINKIDRRITEMDLIEANCSEEVRNIFAAYIIIASSGIVEVGVREILSEYGLVNGDFRIVEFISSKIRHENSLNWEKVKRILGQFDEAWCKKIRQKTEDINIEAISSIQTERNHIAHGEDSVVGYNDAKAYYSRAKSFLRDFEDVILDKK